MNDIFNLIKDNTKTFENFRQWLFIKLDKKTDKFVAIGKSNTRFKLPYLIEYLESKGVDILETLPYYNYKSSNQALKFEELLAYMVTEEFKRIELNKKYSYVPF